MKTDTPGGLIPDPQAHALTLADMILKASEGYEIGTVRAHREQWAIVIAALKAYAVPSERGETNTPGGLNRDVSAGTSHSEPDGSATKPAISRSEDGASQGAAPILSEFKDVQIHFGELAEKEQFDKQETPRTDEWIAKSYGWKLPDDFDALAEFARQLERNMIYWRDLYDRREAQLKTAEADLSARGESYREIGSLHRTRDGILHATTMPGFGMEIHSVVPIFVKECPYCTSDNEAIRSTYYDQTCEGCVKRMGQP